MIPQDTHERFKRLYRAGLTNEARRLLTSALRHVRDTYTICTLTFDLAITEQRDRNYLGSYELLAEIAAHIEKLHDTHLAARYFNAKGNAEEQIWKALGLTEFNQQAKESYAISTCYYEESDKKHLAWHPLNNLAYLLIHEGNVVEATEYLDRAEMLLVASNAEDKEQGLIEIADTRSLIGAAQLLGTK